MKSIFRNLGHTDPREKMIQDSVDLREKAESKLNNLMRGRYARIIEAWEKDGGIVLQQINEISARGGWTRWMQLQLKFTNEDSQRRNLGSFITVDVLPMPGENTDFVTLTAQELAEKI